jgi:hypothetical protein
LRQASNVCGPAHGFTHAKESLEQIYNPRERTVNFVLFADDPAPFAVLAGNCQFLSIQLSCLEPRKLGTIDGFCLERQMFSQFALPKGQVNPP